MPKPKSTAKLVITSVVISFAVIAIFALIFLNYIVPTYQVTEEQIYSVLIKLFPILVGLILIQIGVMIAKRNEDEFKDQVDKLPPNAYTKPFESPAKDDPINISIDAAKAYDQVQQRQSVAEAGVREVIREVPVVKEVIKEVPVEVVREIEKEVPVVREVIKEVQVPAASASDAQPEKIEVPVEVIREVPVEVVKEVEKVVEVPVEVIKEVIREVPARTDESTAASGAQIKEIVKEIPIEIIKEVPIEVPVEKVVEKIVEKEIPVEKIVEKEVPSASAVHAEEETRMLGFIEVLEEECSEANECGNDITLVLIKKKDSLSEDMLEPVFGSNAFIFERADDFALIFSFANEEETASLISAKESRLGEIEFSTATLSGSQADAANLVRMAEAGF